MSQEAMIPIIAGNLHVDGVSMLQKLGSCSIPVPTPITDDFQGTGLPLPVEVPLGAVEKLVAKFTIAGLSKHVQKQLAIIPKASKIFTIRGYAINDTGDKVNVVATMRGLLKAVGQDDIEGKTLVKSQYELVCTYFKYTENGEKIHEIDGKGAVTIVGGVDETPGMNAGLGL